VAEISDYVPGPYQGVSQAPASVRLQGSCETMEDCIATIPNGVQKRPPFTWGLQLKRPDGTAIPADPQARWERIRRGSPSTDVTLLLNREAGVIKPYLFQTATWAPISLTVSTPASTYLQLNAPVPQQDLRVTSIEDVSFITNRTVTVENAAAVQASRPFEAIIWCQTGLYGRNYSITVAPITGGYTVTGSFQTPDGGSPPNAIGVGTDNILQALYAGNANPSGITNAGGTYAGTTGGIATLTSQGFNVVLNGSIIYISHPTNDFVVTVVDGQGGLAMTCIKESVQRFSDLPGEAIAGFVVEIAQESTGALSNYYVQFEATQSATQGVWNEVVAPGANLGLDPTTMPIGLTDTGGTWALAALPWTGRTTGDATLAPDPEFLGDQITDIGWWRGRLALVANGAAELSASDSPYKFYATTLATALDSDHISLLPPVDGKVFFKEAVIFDQRFLIFADEAQAIVQSGTGIVTPSATGIFPLSDGNYTDQVAVQASNHKVYFACLYGNPAQSMAIFEISIDRLSGLALPEDLTPAVPNYLPPTINLAATWKPAYLTVYASQTTGRAIVHAFRYSEQQRVQNAWYAWNLPTGWLWVGMYLEGTVLTACVADPSGNLHGVTMDLTPDRVDPSGGTIQTYLDMRLNETQATSITYNAATGLTTAILPIPVTSAVVATCRAPAGAYPEGYALTVVSTTATEVVLKGDWVGVPLWFGYPINSIFVPSQFYKLGQDGKPEHTGELIIQRVKCDVGAFGYLQATVSQPGTTDQVTTFSGFDLDNSDTPLNSPPNRKTAVLDFGVNAEAEHYTLTFSSSNHRGFKLLGFEWKGSFTPTAQRVT
jgi:hypothetical protein